jgi:hypothetical protein
MRQPPAAFASIVRPSSVAAAVASDAPHFEDYTYFHGMLLGPKRAQRCINSFNGTILFMPHDYVPRDTGRDNRIDKSLAAYDCSPPFLSLTLYYLLVLISFTGFSTICGWTRFLCAEEYDEPVSFVGSLSANSDKQLIADHHVWRYMNATAAASTGRSTTNQPAQQQWQHLALKRRFEFEFLRGLLSVVMFHLVCDQQRLHLVEIYRWKRSWLRHLYRVIFGVPSFLMQFIRRKQAKGAD